MSVEEKYNAPNSSCCGRPIEYAKEPQCNYTDACMDEYCCPKLGSIKETEPDCRHKAVIPSVTVDSVEGITNLANCFVHVNDINTTFYIDDKHRPMITWAGPVDIPGYDMEHNPEGFRDQIITDKEKGIAVIYDKSGKGFTFGIYESLNATDAIDEAITNKLNEMAQDGTLENIIASYLKDAILGFDTVADMKAATNLVTGSYARTLGFHTINDGGGAIYKITDSGIANEIDIIAVGDLYANLISSKTISIKCFGSDTGKDNSLVLSRAFKYCYDNNAELLLDHAISFSTSLTIEDVPNFKSTKALNYTGGENTTAIVIGNTNELNMLNMDIMLKNNSKSTTTVGVKFQNINSSKITLRYLYQFGIGAIFSGNSHGCCYNEVDILNVFYNETGIKLLSESNGWCNENKFNGGKIQYRNSEDYSSAVGIELSGLSNHKINNNLFVKPAFEYLNIGIKGNYAVQNSVIQGRFEHVNYCGYYTESLANYIESGYGTNRSVSNSKTNIVVTQAGKCLFAPTKIYENEIGSTFYISDTGGSNRIYAVNATFMNSGGSVVDSLASDGNFAITNGYVDQTINQKGIGVFVDCSAAKKFFVQAETALGYAGRYYARFYDSDNNVITTSTIGTLDASVSLAANNDLNNSFRTTYDMPEGLLFIAPQNATHVFIGMTRVGTYNLKLKKLEIWADKATTYSSTLS